MNYQKVKSEMGEEKPQFSIYLHFGDVSFIEGGALVDERGVVAHDVVD